MKQNIYDGLKRIIPESLKTKLRHWKQEKEIRRLPEIEAYAAGRYPHGVNLIGPVGQPSGLGQSCRLVKRELEEAGIPVSVINYDKTKGILPTGDFLYDINLIHVNMHEFAGFINSLLCHELDGRYNIAFWLWEMPEFPKQWMRLMKVTDEIWTPSEFSSGAMRRAWEKPVYTIPYYVTAESNHELTRKDFDLPEDRFLFLMLFDKKSCTERKNPDAVIEAYKKAFSETEGVGLVIRIGNADKKDIEEIKRKLKGYHVYFVNKELSKKDLNRLIEVCDCYVSMHRAEGFGLVLAEAMTLGTPTIATGYSANTEFQSADTACLVDYHIVELQKDASLYRMGDRWAEPNVDTCAMYMRKLYSEPAFRVDLIQKAKDSIYDKNRHQRTIEIIKDRCCTIWNMKQAERPGKEMVS